MSCLFLSFQPPGRILQSRISLKFITMFFSSCAYNDDKNIVRQNQRIHINDLKCGYVIIAYPIQN